MKSTVFYILLSLGIAYFTYDLLRERNTHTPDALGQSAPLIDKPALHTAFYQDVSGSIKDNGVNLISSTLFKPYFQEVDRNIELHFGVIEDVSADQLISITLPAKNFSKPRLQDLRKLPVAEKRREKERFLKANAAYIADSIRFYDDRRQRISAFCSRVDSLLSPHRKKLSRHTDLSTAVQIADRVFEFSVFENTENYLLLNSDGHDSYGRDVSGLEHEVGTILINAGRKESTSIDNLKPVRLQSPEQAILFTLHNKNH